MQMNNPHPSEERDRDLPIIKSTKTGIAMDFNFDSPQLPSIYEEEQFSSSPTIPTCNQGMILPQNQSIRDNQEYLNEQLKYHRILSKHFHQNSTFEPINFLSNEPEDIKHVMQIIHTLLHASRSEHEQNELLTEKFNQKEREIERISNRLHQTTNKLREQQQMASEVQNRLKAKEATFIKEKNQLKLEKREIEKNWIQLKHVDQGYRAAARKKEQLYSRLQKQLGDLLRKTMTGGQKKHGIECKKLLNPVAVMAQKHAENDLRKSQNLMKDSNKKEAKLLEENFKFRDSLKTLNMEVKQLQSQYRSAAKLFITRTPDISTSSKSDLELHQSVQFSPARFEMPVEWSENDINSKMSVAIEELKTKLQALEQLDEAQKQRSDNQDQDQQIEALKTQLEQAKEVITEQDRLIQMSMMRESKDRACVEDSLLEKVASELELERSMLSSKSSKQDAAMSIHQQEQDKNIQDYFAEEIDRHGAVFRDYNSPAAGKDFRVVKNLDIDATPATRKLLHRLNLLPPTPKKLELEPTTTG